MKMKSGPWAWVPTAYLAQGLPYATILFVVATLLKDLGFSDGAVTPLTSGVLVIWSLKPLWAEALNQVRTKRRVVVAAELIAGLSLVGTAFALSSLPNTGAVLLALVLLAFAGATQDIAVDGIYITQLEASDQARLAGVQGTAWNMGRALSAASMVWVAGMLQSSFGLEPVSSWRWALCFGAIQLLLLAVYHSIWLPEGSNPASDGGYVSRFQRSAVSFCQKPRLWGMLAFVLLFRSSEGLLLGEAPLYMQAPSEAGGLGLSLQDKALLDGSISTIAGVVGGLLGGAFVARFTLGRTLFFLALCVNVPNACYAYLAYLTQDGGAIGWHTIVAVVCVEKFWFGFGFVGNMLYMMQQLAPGPSPMVHYAFATALMNLALVPIQMVSGPLADAVGYANFFWLVMVATGPSLCVAWLAPFRIEKASPEELEHAAASWRLSVRALAGVLVLLLVDPQIFSLGSGHSLVGLLLCCSALAKIALLWPVLLGGVFGVASRFGNERGARYCGWALVALTTLELAWWIGANF